MFWQPEVDSINCFLQKNIPLQDKLVPDDREGYM